MQVEALDLNTAAHVLACSSGIPRSLARRGSDMFQSGPLLSGGKGQILDLAYELMMEFSNNKFPSLH